VGFTPAKNKSLLKLYESMDCFVDDTDFALLNNDAFSFVSTYSHKQNPVLVGFINPTAMFSSPRYATRPKFPLTSWGGGFLYQSASSGQSDS